MGWAVEPASSAKTIRRERTGRLDLAERTIWSTCGSEQGRAHFNGTQQLIFDYLDSQSINDTLGIIDACMV